MTEPLARLIADLIEGRRRPAWKIVVRLDPKCTHIGRLPAGIAGTAEEARAEYVRRFPILTYARERIEAREADGCVLDDRMVEAPDYGRGR